MHHPSIKKSLIRPTVHAQFCQQSYNDENLHSCIQYALCSDDFSWSLEMSVVTAIQDTSCTEDWVGIAGASASCVHGTASQTASRLCGVLFSTAAISTVSATSVCGKYSTSHS